jgi:hypothetical protein
MSLCVHNRIRSSIKRIEFVYWVCRSVILLNVCSEPEDKINCTMDSFYEDLAVIFNNTLGSIGMFLRLEVNVKIMDLVALGY